MSQVYHVQVPLFTLSKVCTICSQEKSLEEFIADKSKKGGYRAQCKECRREQVLTRSCLTVPPPTKVCSKCDIEKPLEDFYKSRGSKGGVDSKCKDCFHLLNSKTKDPATRRRKMKRTETTQVCRKCFIEKPLEQFSKKSQQKSGYLTVCKDCDFLMYSKSKDLSKRRPKRTIPLTSKMCSRCHIEKPVSEFYKANHHAGGYKAACKECEDANNPHRKRPGIRRESHSKVVAPGYKWCNGCRSEKPIEVFTTDNDKPDGLSTRCNICRAENYKRFLQNCSQASRNLIKDSVHRRRARMQETAIGDVDYQTILERYGYWCHICEQNILSHHKLHFDHVIPLARGGPHIEQNLKPSHSVCNSRKGKKLLEEMTPYQRRGPSH